MNTDKTNTNAVRQSLSVFVLIRDNLDLADAAVGFDLDLVLRVRVVLALPMAAALVQSVYVDAADAAMSFGIDTRVGWNPHSRLADAS